MPKTKVEKWDYETGTYNKHAARSYQTEVRDEVTGAVIAQGPVRDNPEDAKQDARELRQQSSKKQGKGARQ